MSPLKPRESRSDYRYIVCDNGDVFQVGSDTKLEILRIMERGAFRPWAIKRRLMERGYNITGQDMFLKELINAGLLEPLVPKKSKPNLRRDKLKRTKISYRVVDKEEAMELVEGHKQGKLS